MVLHLLHGLLPVHLRRMEHHDDACELLHRTQSRLGIAPILGQNDYTYSDRSVVCIQNEANFQAMLASQVIASDKATLIDNTGNYNVGFRLIKRDVHTALDAKAQAGWTNACKLIASTLDHILHGCEALGYSNLTIDFIRLSDDTDSPRTYAIAGSLPILLTPHWDNAPYGRHAIPTFDGDACMFRLHGTYEDKSIPNAFMRGIDRELRHARTVEWLKRPGGQWRHGWYEDLQGDKWVAEMRAHAHHSALNTPVRQFDMRTGVEADCQGTDACREMSYYARWGSKFSTNDRYYDADEVYVGNPKGEGLFHFKSQFKRVVTIKYDWETLLSNVTVVLLLFRWMVAMIALHRGFTHGDAAWRSGGIGCIASARSFVWLPLATLPRLKMILCAFWTIGCNFEGEQSGLSEAWFVMYPSIVSFVLLYFSVLNIGAKILRRRISDALFAPTITVLCVLHYFRLPLAANGFFKGVDSRVSTLVFSDEVERMQLLDFFRSDIAVRLDGRVYELVRGKVAILAINLLPLVFSRSLPVVRRQLAEDGWLSLPEVAMAIRKDNVGGIASVDFPVKCHRIHRRVSAVAINPMRYPVHVTLVRGFAGPRLRPILDSYEVIRLGYVVFGGQLLIRADDWDVIASMAFMRAFFHLWNHRVAVWVLDEKSGLSDANGVVRRTLRSTEPTMCRLDDSRLLKISFWDISAVDIE
jgi:hypothetical protein